MWLRRPSNANTHSVPCIKWSWSIRKVTSYRGASVSACAGLTNQLLSCWVDPRIAWIKHWHNNCRWPVDEGWGTPRPVLLISSKKSHLGCLITFELPMGFQNFVVINKIHPLKKTVTPGYKNHGTLVRILFWLWEPHQECCSHRNSQR